jgi:hypothetical protein
MEGHPINARLLKIVKQFGLLKILTKHAGKLVTPSDIYFARAIERAHGIE